MHLFSGYSMYRSDVVDYHYFYFFNTAIF